MKANMRTRRPGVAGWVLAAMLSALVVVAAAYAAPQAAPVNVEPPTITGTARVGELLTAQNGTWDNSPTEFRYRWLRCNRGGNSCALLAADGKTYRVAQADVGSTLRVRVTAVNVDGSTNARSEQTEVVGSNAAPLSNTARPTITGEARVGQELTANEGTWTGSPTSFSFQWQRCNIDAITCLDVTGATGRTYGVRLADLGFRLRVQVVARKDRTLGDGDLAAYRRCPAHHSRHEQASDAADPEGDVPGGEGVPALPRLRRHRDQSRDPRPRDAPRRATRAATLRYACPAASVRCVHAELASGTALPWPRPLHDHRACA